MADQIAVEFNAAKKRYEEALRSGKTHEEALQVVFDAGYELGLDDARDYESYE